MGSLLCQVLHVLVQLVQGGEAGQQLLDLLVEDQDMHVMLASAAMAVMPLLDPIAHREGSLGLSSALRLALIHFYTALLSLIGCQPSVTFLYFAVSMHQLDEAVTRLTWL